MNEDIKIRKNNIWIILLYVIGILCLLLIIGFVIFRMTLNTKKENNEKLQKLSTSRRTTTSSLTEPTTIVTTEEITTSTTISTTISSTTTSITTSTNKKSTTTIAEEEEEEEEVTTKKIKTTAFIIPEEVRTPTTSTSTNPNALDDWEWKILEYINNNRTTKGLNKLVVASELRNIAETGIDNSYTIKDLDKNLSDYSNYHTITATINNSTELYNNMIKDKIGSLIVTDPNITYVGIGVIRKLGPDGINAYYGVVIFE